MPTERFTFAGHGGHDLAARLDLPDGPHLTTAIFAHCFTCSKDIHAARRIAGRLAMMGIAVLRFDFTGLGHSDGEFENTHFTSNVEDLILAAKALSARGMSPQMLIGHSLGGAAVLKATSQIPGIHAVVAIGAPFDPSHVAHTFADALPAIRRDGSAEVSLGGRPFRIGQTFVDDISQGSLAQAIGGLKAALLVLHAPRDEMVGIDNATEIFRAAKHPKSFVTLDTADHLITRAADADYAAGVIAAWVTRYLALEPPAPPPDVPEGIVRVSEADANGFLQDIQSGPHHALADEPKLHGGTDRGMSPYGFLAAGLGACTAMTIRMYARRKNWALTHVSVDVSHSKVHAQDADALSPAKLDTFHRVIRLEGDLGPDERTKLREIADKCPVHRTLEQSASISTELV